MPDRQRETCVYVPSLHSPTCASTIYPLPLLCLDQKILMLQEEVFVVSQVILSKSCKVLLTRLPTSASKLSP